MNILATLKVVAQEWSQGLEQARRDLGAMTDELESMKAEARDAGLFLTGIAAAGALLGTKALQEYAAFEQAIANVGAVAQGTEEDMRLLEQAALRVGGTTRLSAMEAAGALYELASAGFDTGESIAALDGVANLALATQSDLATSTMLVTSTLAQFRLEADEAGRVADVFVNAIGASPANVEKLSNALRQVGPTAGALGVSLEETTAVLMGLFEAGLRGQQAGTALRNILLSLIQPTAQNTEVLGKYGLTFDDVNPRVVGLTGAIETLREANLSTADAAQLFGTQAVSAYLTLANLGGEALRELEEGLMRQGTASEVARRQLDTLQGSLDIFKSTLSTLLIITGGFLATFARPLVDGATMVLNAFNVLPAPLQAAIVALGAAGTAATGLLGTFLLFGPRIGDFIARWDLVVRAVSSFPLIVQGAIGALAAKASALGAAATAAAAYTLQMGRAILITWPTAIVQSIIATGQAMVAASAQALGLTTATAGATAGMNLFQAAMVRVQALLASNPLGVAIFAALSALALLVVGIQNDVGGLGSAWEQLKSAFEPMVGVVQTLGHAFGRVFATALEGVAMAAAPIVPILTNGIAVAAGVVALALNAAALAIGTFGAGLQLVADIATGNWAGAWTRFNNSLDEIDAKFRETNAVILDSMLGIERSTDSVTARTRDWREELERTKSSFTGTELLNALGELRKEFVEAFGDTSAAVKAVDAEIEALAGQLAEAAQRTEQLRKEAVQLVKDFEATFEGKRISLIEDDETRRIAQVRLEYAKIREDIIAAAEANEEFAKEAPRLLREAAELEGQEIERITRETAKRREEEQRKAYEELQNLIQTRERQLIDLRLDIAGSDLQRLTENYRRQVEDAEKFYRDLEQRAQGNAGELARIAQLRAQELTLLEQKYLEDVQKLYAEVYAQLEQRELDLTRAQAQARGDRLTLAQLDFQKALADIASFYDDAERRAEGNAELLALIADQRTRAVLQAEREYLEAAAQINREILERVEQREAEHTRAVAQANDDRRTLERLEFEQRIAQLDRQYQDDLKLVGDNQEARRRLFETYMAQRELLEKQHHENLRGIADEETAKYVDSQVKQLLKGLDAADLATLESMKRQLEAWASVYGADSPAGKLVAEALEQVEARMVKAREEIAKEIEKLLQEAERMADAVRLEAIQANLNALENIFFGAGQKIEDLQAKIRELEAVGVHASAEQQAQLAQGIANLQEAIAIVQARAIQEAEKLVEEATRRYNEGLAKAVTEAAGIATNVALEQLEQGLARVVAVNETAILQARNELSALIARLQELGATDEDVAQLRQRMEELNQLLANRAQVVAELAARNYAELRQLANAVLDEDRARQVVMQTLQAEVRLRKEAVTEGKEQNVSYEDMRSRLQALVAAQLNYAQALRNQIDSLQANRREVLGVFDALGKLSNAFGFEVPRQSIDSLKELTESLLFQVLAAQEAGESYSSYKDALDQALAFFNQLESFGLSEDQLERLRKLFEQIFGGLAEEAANAPTALATLDAEIERLSELVDKINEDIAAKLDFEVAGRGILDGYKDVMDLLSEDSEALFGNLASNAVAAFMDSLDAARRALQEELFAEIGVFTPDQFDMSTFVSEFRDGIFDLSGLLEHAQEMFDNFSISLPDFAGGEVFPQKEYHVHVKVCVNGQDATPKIQRMIEAWADDDLRRIIGEELGDRFDDEALERLGVEC